MTIGDIMVNIERIKELEKEKLYHSANRPRRENYTTNWMYHDACKNHEARLPVIEKDIEILKNAKVI